MSERNIRVSWRGDGKFFSLDSHTARVLVDRMARENRFTRHEWSLLDLDDAPGVHTPVTSSPLRLHTRLKWVCDPSENATPERRRISTRELRRLEGLLSSRALSGRWRVCAGEGEIHRVVCPTPRGRRYRSALGLHALLFEIESISFANVVSRQHRDFVVQRRDSSFSVVRYEGLAKSDSREGRPACLESVIKNRSYLTQVDRFSHGQEPRRDRDILRWFSINEVTAREGFALTCGVSLSL